MKKFGSIIFALLVTGLCLYSLLYISVNNICTGVRSFGCTPQVPETTETNESIVPVSTPSPVATISCSVVSLQGDIYRKVISLGRLFLYHCVPTVYDQSGTYVLDYSSCDVRVTLDADSLSVQKATIAEKIIDAITLQKILSSTVLVL